MRRPPVLPIALLLSVGCASVPQLTYPTAHRGDHVDEYHGVRVADPYRWLESTDSPESRAWIDAQVSLTTRYLDALAERPRIRKRIEQVWNYERYGVPFEEGGRYFYTKNDGLQAQSVLYVADSLEAAPRVLLDPNTLREDGTVSLKRWTVSDDGKRLAYQLSDAGSDWVQARIRDIDSGKDLDDHLKWLKFSGLAWLPDSSGFLYSRYDPPAAGQKLKQQNYFQKLYLHRVGTPQADDLLVYERKDEKEWGFSAGVTDDGTLLVVHVWMGAINKTQVFYRQLDPAAPQALSQAPMVELIAGFDADYEVIDNDGRTLFVQTNLDAPKGRVVAVDLDRPERASWKTVIPESKDTLRSVSMVGGDFFALYLADAHSVVRRFGPDGRPSPTAIELPGLGTVEGFSGERDDDETFFRFDSFTSPPTIYRYDVKTGATSVFRKSAVAANLDDYVTRQVWVTSKDGTKLPMFVSHKKGADAPDSPHGARRPAPTYLYGYGGFNVSLSPRFSPVVATWLEMGGVFAQPTLRGGGEYGEAWHQAGMKTNKQNVFDDFIAAAEHLVQAGLTTPAQLAIAGGSNGGLLVGACMTQRPELFAAAVPAVGVMDMLRFQEFTIGWAWVPEYGSSTSEAPEEFKALHALSPLHALARPGRHSVEYPATLITTADHDDRVFPAHSFKFAAQLQHTQPPRSPDPVLIRIETRAGHGAGTPTAKRIEEAADKLAFLTRHLSIALPPSFGR